MRTFNYHTHWHYLEEPTPRSGSLLELLIDYPYSFRELPENEGFCMIPPWEVMNKLCQQGGTDGGMSPGSTWEGFELTKVEYQELKRDLLELKVDENFPDKHPYSPRKFVIDEELNDQYPSSIDWEREFMLKYIGFDLNDRFSFLDTEYPILYKGQQIAMGSFLGFTGQPQPLWALKVNGDSKKMAEIFQQETHEDVQGKHYWTEHLGIRVKWKTTDRMALIELEDYSLQRNQPLEIYYCHEEGVLVFSTDRIEGKED